MRTPIYCFGIYLYKSNAVLCNTFPYYQYWNVSWNPSWALQSSICLNIIRLSGSLTMCRNLTPEWKHSALCARRCRCWRSYFFWCDSTSLNFSWLSLSLWSRGPLVVAKRHVTGATGWDARRPPGGASGCDGACDMILNNPTPWQPRQQCCRFGRGRESEGLAGGGSECVAECRNQLLFLFLYLVQHQSPPCEVDCFTQTSSEYTKAKQVVDSDSAAVVLTQWQCKDRKLVW